MANGNFVHIPFNPANDPLTQFGRALQPGLDAFSKRIQEQREIGRQRNDIAAIKQWVDGGMEGPTPNTSTEFGQTLTANLVMRQANEAIADPDGRTLRLQRQKLTQEHRLSDEQAIQDKKTARVNRQLRKAQTKRLEEPISQTFGVTPWYLSPENRNKPAAQAALKKALEGSTDLEALRFWQGIKNNAAGDFFNPTLDGGTTEPDDPEMYEFATKRLLEVKKRMEKSGTAATGTSEGGLPFPQTQEEYDGLLGGTEYRYRDGSIRRKPK